ncbi:group II intron reverse transcriptase/maturase [Prosthecochloris sp. HL-130-GSB]|uniref:group II intron reverse transcriptase/maturase n=1 Tax=Prosthecochloris sp. HL-130-GSB TaxID=1974213 RepID=UPI000A1C06DD|nr:group II intron reverse transcriptase/maturase [Prosthecochloris sp. HL-130-GSB]ARM31934.1 group II intron reverse transcriptase/maturase [Prosthecochloris sp. HL-130-GSB]
MNTATTVCAPSGPSWTGINWSRVQRQVKKLQARIVKATQEGRYGKVKALQWLLTHSLSGKALAVKRVTENRGKHTPGVDNIIWNTPTAKTNAIASLQRRGYKPLPLRRIHIPKKNGKTRPLGIPAMKDRAMQALYLLALEPVAETTADLNSYGFRPERSTADASHQCFICLAGRNRAQWVLEADIAGCFDAISHQWLIDNIPVDKAMLQKWLKAGFVFQNKLFPTEAGTPQGGIISPVLANMTLDGLEQVLATAFPRAKQQGRKMNMVRYADDFIITGHSKEWLQDEVMPVLTKFLSQRGLQLSQEKTRVTHITEGFDFLGWNMRKYGGKLLIKPSKQSIQSHLKKVKEIIKANKATKQVLLIGYLNPVLRGWANYHRYAVAKRTFANNDSRIWFMLWQWAKRRHPNKGARWVKAKYFTTQRHRNWVFAAMVDPRKKQRLTLFLEGSTPIKRYNKIRMGANPHDPVWRPYFEARKKQIIKSTPKCFRVPQ